MKYLILIACLIGLNSCAKCYQCKAVAGSGSSQTVIPYEVCGTKAEKAAAESAGTYGGTVTTCE